MLPDVGVPVLVVQSSDDVVTPDHAGTYLEATLPDCTLVRLDAVAHFPQSSDPEQTASAIFDYLSRT